jgi:RNA polymerase sigma factor (sigma-70 family)
MESDVEDETREDLPKAPTASVVETFVANHRELLRFVERRVGSRATAEEILQDAFVRSLDHADEIRESTLGWLYRVLRNAVIDHQRRRAVEDRRLEALAAELANVEPDDELARVACRCVGELASTLKPEQADVLRRVEIDGMAVKDYAAAVGISASNAGVRIFRARKALREQVARACGTCAEHGCLDCSCGSPAPK